MYMAYWGFRLSDLAGRLVLLLVAIAVCVRFFGLGVLRGKVSSSGFPM